MLDQQFNPYLQQPNLPIQNKTNLISTSNLAWAFNIIISINNLQFRTRSISGAISSTFNLACLFLVLKFYTSLADIINYHGVYWYIFFSYYLSYIALFFSLFAGVNMIGVIFVFCFLPETKGKSLKEIEDIFAKKKIIEESLWYNRVIQMSQLPYYIVFANKYRKK